MKRLIAAVGLMGLVLAGCGSTGGRAVEIGATGVPRVPPCKVSLSVNTAGTQSTATIISGCQGNQFTYASFIGVRDSDVFDIASGPPWTVNLPPCRWQTDFTFHRAHPNKHIYAALVGGSGTCETTTTTTTTTTTVAPTTSTTTMNETPLPTNARIEGNIYLCVGGLPTTTLAPVTGDDISVPGLARDADDRPGFVDPDDTVTVAGDHLDQPAASGTYTMDAAPPTGYTFAACDQTGVSINPDPSASEPVTVPAGGVGVGNFYVVALASPSAVTIPSGTPVAPVTPITAPPTPAPGCPPQDPQCSTSGRGLG